MGKLQQLARLVEEVKALLVEMPDEAGVMVVEELMAPGVEIRLKDEDRGLGPRSARAIGQRQRDVQALLQSGRQSGVTLKGLAAQTGVSFSTVRKALSGHTITPEMIRKIEAAFQGQGHSQNGSRQSDSQKVPSKTKERVKEYQRNYMKRLTSDPALQRFATTLTKMRQARGLTQDKLVRQLDCSLTSITRLENGKTVPSVQLVEQLANVFGVSVSDFPDLEHLRARTQTRRESV